MKFVWITGYSGSGKTTLELNLRRQLDVLYSRDKCPAAGDIAFFGCCIKRNGKIRNNFGTDLYSSEPLIEVIERLNGNVKYLVSNGVGFPFSKRSMKRLLEIGTDITVFFNNRSKQRAFKQFNYRRENCQRFIRNPDKEKVWNCYKDGHESARKKWMAYAERFDNIQVIDPLKSMGTRDRVKLLLKEIETEMKHANIKRCFWKKRTE